MTLIADNDLAGVAPQEAPPVPRPRPAANGDRVEPPPLTLSPRRLVLLVLMWSLVSLAGFVLVLYGLGPIFHQRDQRLVFEQFRQELERSANESFGLPGVQTVSKAPEIGAPVGVLEIGGIGVQQVTLEGVSSSVTAEGPGHVVGTAGLGQPGNSVLVGRRGAFGGPFGDIGALHSGDVLLVTTTQGQTVYKVDTVREQQLVKGTGEASTAAATPSSSAADEPQADPLAAGTVDIDLLYGASKDDRLTLVTSASANPLNGTAATVVVAKLQGKPLAPLAQGGRTDAQTGAAGDATAWPALVLALLAYVTAVVAAVVLYRRSSGRVAYLLTAAPLLAFTVLAAESLSRLLPAWT